MFSRFGIFDFVSSSDPNDIILELSKSKNELNNLLHSISNDYYHYLGHIVKYVVCCRITQILFLKNPNPNPNPTLNPNPNPNPRKKD